MIHAGHVNHLLQSQLNPNIPICMQGYNAAAIEKNTEEKDKQWHAVLQDYCYRLPILECQKSVIDRQVESELQELEAKLKSSKLKKHMGLEGKKGDGKDGKDKAGSKSSSSSSSSSSSKKKKKRSKKDKKEEREMTEKDKLKAEKDAEKAKKRAEDSEKRQREKDAKAAQTAVTKHNTTVAGLATRALVPLQNAIAAAESVLKKPASKSTPSTVYDQVVTDKTQLSEYKNQADAVLKQASKVKAGTRLPELEFALTTVTSACTAAQQNARKLEQMISLASPVQVAWAEASTSSCCSFQLDAVASSCCSFQLDAVASSRLAEALHGDMQGVARTLLHVLLRLH